MSSIPHDAFFITIYCSHAGFFALDAKEQRALLAASCEPTYASFNDGDGTFTRPLEIVFHNLRDATSHIFFHQCRGKYPLISENLNDVLLRAIYALHEAHWHDANFFDNAHLDEPLWNALRAASRDVWNALDEAHRLPFGNWRDFAG